MKMIEMKARETNVMMNSYVETSYTITRVCKIASDKLIIKFRAWYRVFNKYPDVIGMWKKVRDSIPIETTTEEAHVIAVEVLKGIMEVCGGELLLLETIGEARSHEPIRVVYQP